MVTQAAPVLETEGRTVASYFDSFGPGPPWEELVGWPPDVFALANLVLDHTEAYRFVVAPPPGASWPPEGDWNEQTRRAAAGWRWAAQPLRGELPELIARNWAIVTRERDTPLERIRSGEAWELTTALLTLHATADEACAEVVSAGRSEAASSFESRAWQLLQERGTLSRLSPARIRIVPKLHFANRGITIRSVSRYLALAYEAVDVRYRSRSSAPKTRRRHRLLLLPWPLTVRARDFRPADPACLANMEADRFGFFEFVPESCLDRAGLDCLLRAAVEQEGPVDAVLLPEAAVLPEEIPELERALVRHGIPILVGGVRQPATALDFGRNYLHFGIHDGERWERYEQDKHHRWGLDESQIRQYHLARALDPARLWWEAIDIRERALHVIDLGDGTTVAPLICEDFARLDEVSDLVRRVGPSLVIALLLDGPQLGQRWPARYASLVTDDPGCAALTLTSYGMATRCRPPGKPRSRVIAHWNSPADGPCGIELEPRAGGVLVSAVADEATVWTADGRRHPDVPQLRLEAVGQVRPRARSRASGGSRPRRSSSPPARRPARRSRPARPSRRPRAWGD